MKPTTFPEANQTLVANPMRPDGPDGSPIADLPTWTDGGQITSCWRPSWAERLSILCFGRVWLSVLGDRTPPVAILGCRQYFTPAPAPGERKDGDA